MRILIFGAGAIGQAVGCMLASGGHDVDMIVRERFVKPLRSKGLTVTGIFGDHYARPDSIGIYPRIEHVLKKRYDYALITTKSYDTAVAVSEIEKIHNQTFIVVSMQNGCGNLEKIIERYGEYRTLGARVITGFEIEESGYIRITVTADKIHIGGYTENTVPSSAAGIADAINTSGLPCVTTPFIKRDLFAKLLYNCALNPLGAALGVHYGALGDDSNTRSIMSTVIREVFAVIEAMGEKTHWERPDEYESFFYNKQIPATYHHRSSMIQDLEIGKKTEVDALTRYVSSQGKKYNVPTPVCDTLSKLIRFMEKTVHTSSFQKNDSNI